MMASRIGMWWQKSRVHSWWQKIRSGLGWLWQKITQHLFIAIGILVLLIACITFALAVHWFGLDWTGFNGGYGKITTNTPAKDTELPPAKTLWDWLQILIVPLILAIGGFWFNKSQKDREERATERRDTTEREIAADNQRETALQDYLDKMSELLLKERLGKRIGDGIPELLQYEQVRNVARVRTITVLTQLDSRRIGHVFAFLREAGLMSTTSKSSVVSLKDADLRTVKWERANLRRANLSEANLREANLS